MFRAITILTFLSMFALPAKADFVCPPLQGRVNDYANLIPSAQKEALEAKLKELEEKTSAQVAILTVSTTSGEDFKDYTFKVAETWALGQKGKDNGLLIGYTPEGDHFRIQVGYGLEGAIPDGKAGKIRDDQFRKFAPKDGQKDFVSAFMATTDEVSRIISDEFAKDPTGKSMRGINKEHVALLIVLLVVVLIVGCIHPIAGLVGGAICGGVAGSVVGLIALWIIVGCIVGVGARMIVQIIGDILVRGGGGGFSGGGGGFGGGGAGD